MALVLGATGVFVYLRFAHELDGTLNAGLRSRAKDVSVLLRDTDFGIGDRHHGDLVDPESVAEVLDINGAALDATPAIGGRVLLNPAELHRAAHEPVLVDRGPLPGLKESSRLLAAPVLTRGVRRIVIVGTSTSARSESLSDLLALLLVGGPVALLLASVTAYWVAAAALAPVEEMRVMAAAVSASRPGQRLPVPPGDDEIGRLGTTLNAMLERLEEALAHERRFVADASHELRTPLAILKAEVDLALSRGRTPSELTAALASAAEETDRLVRLAEDLLTIAQTDRGDLPMRRAPTDIHEVLQAVATRFARRAGDVGFEMEVIAQPGLIARVDRLRVEQALGNLLDNALRYGKGPVQLSAWRNGPQLQLHVRDRGAGFSAQYLPRAFERFSRDDANRSDGGSGLGLAIVEAIARGHDGTAQVSNREGGGADASLLLTADTQPSPESRES
jgi:two-component system OmpR family sensor kinase